MGLLTAEALQGYAEYTKRVIAKGRYKVGNVWHDAGTPEVNLQSDGSVTADILVDHTVPGDITIQEFQLLDTKGRLFCGKAESVARKDSQEGVLYRFSFTITEG